MPLSDRGKATRDAILKAAIDAFAESGFHGTKLRALARRAGVNQGLIHHYFGSKEALLNEVLQRAAEDLVESQAAQWQRVPTDVRFFTEGLRVVFEWMGRQQKVARIFLWVQLEGRAPPPGPESEVLVARVREKFLDAQRAGVLRSDVNVDMALLVVDAVFRGFWNRALEFPNIDQLAEPYLRESLEVLLRGLFTDAALAEAMALLDASPSDR